MQLSHWFTISDMSQSLPFVGNCSGNSHFSQILVLLAWREVVAHHPDSKCRHQAQTSWIIKKLIQSEFVTWFLCSINKDLNLNNLRCEQLQSLLKRNKSFVSQHCRQRPWRLETRTFHFHESCAFNCCWCYFQWKRSQHLAKASVKSSNLNLLEKAAQFSLQIQQTTVKSRTINISKCFGDIIDHASEAPMVCDVTRNPRSIYSCLHTSLVFCCMGYIDPNINENYRKLQKHEKRNIPFCPYLFPASMFCSFLTQFSVSPLPWLPFFIFRFIGIFRSFEILASVSYSGVWKYL